MHSKPAQYKGCIVGMRCPRIAQNLLKIGSGGRNTRSKVRHYGAKWLVVVKVLVGKQEVYLAEDLVGLVDRSLCPRPHCLDCIVQDGFQHSESPCILQHICQDRFRIRLQRLVILSDHIVQEFDEWIGRLAGEERLDIAADFRMLGLRSINIDIPVLMHFEMLDGSARQKSPDMGTE